MRKPTRRTKARKVASRLSCRTVHLRNPPFRHPKNRSTRLRAFRSAFRRRNARFPPRVRFPRRGFFGMPARIPRRRNPSRIAFASSAASAPAPSCSSSPAGPPAPPPTDDNRAHSQVPPLHSREAHLHSPKRALSSLFASYAHLFLHLPPFFRLHPRGINRHRFHLHLPQRIPPVQKGLQDLVPDPLLPKFPKPPPGRRIGAIWAGHIAPPATCNPHIQDPVEDLAVIHPRSSGFGPGRPQGRKESPLLIDQLLNPHRPPHPRQVVRRQSILQPGTGVLR